jgi:hypothetical protein
MLVSVVFLRGIEAMGLGGYRLLGVGRSESGGGIGV